MGAGERGGEGRGGEDGRSAPLNRRSLDSIPGIWKLGNSRSLTMFFRILTFKINKASNSNSRT